MYTEIREYVRFVPSTIGPGAINLIADKVKELGGTKALIVADAFLEEPIATIKGKLDEAGIPHVEFTDIVPDPTDTSVYAGTKLAKEAGGVDIVIAMGGGSAMDTAKAINVLLKNPEPLNRYYVTEQNIAPEPSYPIIAIPSTSGTGSESTFAAMVTNTEAHGKRALRSDGACLPKLALLDPELTYSMPPALTANSGVDAFSHAAEAFSCKKANPVSDALAREAMEMIVKYLPRAVADGNDKEARYYMYVGSNLAGMAVSNSLCHFGHSFGHSLGAVTHIPHGACMAAAIPETYASLAKVEYDKIKWMAELVGGEQFPDGISAKELEERAREAFYKFIEVSKAPTLKDYGVTREQVMKTAEIIPTDGAFDHAKYIPTAEDIKGMLTRIADRFC